MSVLRGNNGPRYRHSADEAAPYETITVDKLTPIIGAEIGGVDLSQPLRQPQLEEIHRALAENLVIFFRDQHMTQRPAPRLRPPVRRSAHPSRRAARAGPSGADDHPRRQGLAARQRRGLAHRRVLRPGAADGQHPLHQAMPAARRRHAVRQHVRRLRRAVGPHEGLSRRADRRSMTASTSIAASTRTSASPTSRSIRAPSIRWSAPIR